MEQPYLLSAVYTTVIVIIGYLVSMRIRFGHGESTKTDETSPRKIPKVILWTAPRCVSTAFERAIIEIPNGKIFHEPFSVPYYFGPRKISARYKHENTEQASYEETAKLLSKPYEEDKSIDFVFSKDMAYYVTQYKPDCSYYSYLLSNVLTPSACFVHTFLIRRPDKTVVSLYKASLNEALTGWNYFDPKEVGFADLYLVYKKCTELRYDVVIIDADELLADPAKILKLYCERVGLRFSEDILSWKPGQIEAFQLWDGWHDGVMNSSGFTKRSKQEIASKEANLKQFLEKSLPKEVQQDIKDAFVVYNELYSNRLH